MLPRDRQLRIDDILQAIARIESYVAGLTFEQFQADQKTIDAVVRNLEVIGEAVRHLSADSANLPTGIAWADIAAMRNILIHEYFGVDTQIVWQTIEADLPSLRDELRRLAR